MCRQIRKMNSTKEPQKNKKRYKTKHIEVIGGYVGDKVQIDIKYVPMKCLEENEYNKKYYQITVIDEYSRKRVLLIVDEKSITNRIKFLENLEEKMGFEINTVQTDNGSEFVNNSEETSKLTAFEEKLNELNIKHKRTKPYLPWQNGKVERSHRTDGERFYNKVYKNIEKLIKSLKRYVAGDNSRAKKILGFKSPNQSESLFNKN
ncbi:MAG: DDE-type integrase/transposase/recombinase [Lachnospirales bacterium]